MKTSIFESDFEMAITRNNIGERTQVGSFNIVRTGRTTQISDDVMDCTYTHDGNGLLTSHSCTIATNAVFSHELERDENSTTILKRTVETGDSSPVEYVYTYDMDGQLETVSVDGSQTESYQYDMNGNRESATVSGTQYSATYDGSDTLQTFDGEAYTYTVNGYLEDRGSRGQLQYNSNGELVCSDTPNGQTVHRYQAKRIDKNPEMTLKHDL